MCHQNIYELLNSQTVTNWNGIHAVPLVPLRIFTGLLMIHHGSEGKIIFCQRPYKC